MTESQRLDPLSVVPDPLTVRQRLGRLYRLTRLLRQQLKVAERCRDERRADGPSSPRTMGADDE